MATADITIKSCNSGLSNQRRQRQQEMLFERIALMPCQLEKELTKVMQVDEDTLIEAQEIAFNSTLLLNQIGWMADTGTGIASGTDVPTLKRGAEEWLMPWGYHSLKKSACI